MAIQSVSVPKYWEKTSKDVWNDTWGNARDIGYIRKDYSRISVVSSLNANDDDSKDWYKFLVQTKGDLSMSIRTDADTGVEEPDPNSEDYFQDIIDYFSGKGLTLELYNNQGGRQKLVAGNDKENAEAFANFEKLIRGELTVGTGQYYMKVATSDGQIPKNDINYVLQFQMGTDYKHDYATIENAQNLSETEKYQNRMNSYSNSMYSEEVQGLLDSVTTNSLILQGQAAATLLESGASNMTNILNANKQKAKGISTIFNFTS